MLQNITFQFLIKNYSRTTEEEKRIEERKKSREEDATI